MEDQIVKYVISTLGGGALAFYIMWKWMQSLREEVKALKEEAKEIRKQELMSVEKQTEANTKVAVLLQSILQHLNLKPKNDEKA